MRIYLAILAWALFGSVAYGGWFVLRQQPDPTPPPSMQFNEETNGMYVGLITP